MDTPFPPDARCLIGVSGGRDSVALLHLLLDAGFKKLVVCHLDHALRAESAEDARFVAALAKQLGLKSVVARENVAARAKRKRQSLETAAREARYAFFARVARAQKCPRLFLAHHADDQVETLLFNLFRGSAAAGLAGMRPLTEREIGGVTLQIARPLLGMWREEIDAYIAAHGLAFREDASNTDPHHTRNRLRHEIIPGLERTLGRDIRRSVWRAAEILRDEDDFLASQPALRDLPETLETSTLRAQPIALQRRIIHSWLKTQLVTGVGFDDVEAVRGLLTGSRAKINLPGGWHARRRAKQIFLDRPGGTSLCD
ncbi:MAG: tRNA lysidine(34) synthetase TilS [Chthoniobacter sp.]|nr:tRNA lysidine(34) synthetase TilS [Chthoniobacter sp.]